MSSSIAAQPPRDTLALEVGSRQVNGRSYAPHAVKVEGTNVTSWKVEERRQVDRSLVAVWYLIDKKPYMVYGEQPLPNGQIRRMTEVETRSAHRSALRLSART